MQDTFNIAQEQEQYETASIFERTVALLLDVFLFMSAFIWSYYFILMNTDIFDSAFLESLYGISFNILFILYCGFFASGGRQTLGKWLAGIKVVRVHTREALSFSKGIIRALGYYVNIFTLFAGFGLALVNKKSRALEDILAGSEVITIREKTTGEATVLSAFGTILIALVIFYVYFVLFKLPSVYQQSQIDGAKEQLNRISKLEQVHRQNFGTYTSDLVRLGLISGDPVQFQRDIQRNLRPRGFSIGISKEGYKITGIAKDGEDTQVTVEK